LKEEYESYSGGTPFNGKSSHIERPALGSDDFIFGTGVDWFQHRVIRN